VNWCSTRRRGPAQSVLDTPRGERGGIMIAAEAPKWTDVFQALGTIGAFAIALILLFVQMRDRRRAHEDQLRDQARLVSAWVTGWTGDVVEWEVRNGSEEPVYQCRLCAVAAGTAAVVEAAYPILPPHGVRSGSGRLDGWTGTPLTPRPFIRSLTFIDSQGIEWRRTEDGALVPLRYFWLERHLERFDEEISAEFDHFQATAKSPIRFLARATLAGPAFRLGALMGVRSALTRRRRLRRPSVRSRRRSQSRPE
jgi:hypothetical protein